MHPSDIRKMHIGFLITALKIQWVVIENKNDL